MDLSLLLRDRFGFTEFRPAQKQVIDKVMAGANALAVMPTGSGKSLGYQLPALGLPGLTLVVSPLVALMKDQVDELARRGIPAAALHSLATPEERRSAIAAARAGALKLLYVAPERFAYEGFDRLLGELRVARFAVVGAHRALVYAATRKSSEAAADALVAAGIPAAAYHAGLDDETRRRVQDEFAAGTLRVVCATNAFGMGIDRPDVARVVHWELPGSLEAYYQEVGRAGRDGRDSEAILLWNRGDIRTREFLLSREDDDDPRRRDRAPVD